MELKDLKSAWDKVSSENERKGQLPEEEFRKMLKNRTVDITDRIGRNIRIGIIIVIAWIALWFVSDIILSDIILDDMDSLLSSHPFIYWLTYIETSSYLLIVIGIIIFWIRYNKIKKTKISSTNLKTKLTLLIKHLNSYKKMFYIVLGLIIISIVASFSTGFFEGYNYALNETGLDINNLTFIKWTFTVIAFLICLIIITLIYYLLFNLFFKRLYGRYLKQLKQTLKELEEPVSES